MSRRSPHDPAWRDKRRLLDVNVLLALIWDQHIHHHVALTAFAALTGGFATTPVTESGLVRLLLTPAVVGRPVTANEALSTLRAIRAHTGWRAITDDTALTDAAIDVRVLTGRRQVTDLHLVDLAARNDCVLATFDAALLASLAPDDRQHVDLWCP
ncbi:MAG: PIN domain nuclease [Actinomycetales bacterium]|nr:MAG: PIN domain nuclease [Actinomycetales bacterium]